MSDGARFALFGLGLGLVGLLLLPVTVVTVVVFWVAWWRGWSPTRARWLVLGSWTLPAAVWLAGSSPQAQLDQAWQIITTADALYETAAAWVPLSPWLLALGITNGAVLWAVKWSRARSGVFRSPRAAGEWQPRQWQHAMKRATKEARKPWLVPMMSAGGDPVLGRAAMVGEAGASRIVPHDPRLLVVPRRSTRNHMVVIGEPGAGKTVLLLRMTAAWLQTAWLGHVEDARGKRPLSIFIDCKGGPVDGPDTAARFRKTAERLGIAPNRIGWWRADKCDGPDDLRFDLWGLEPHHLVEVLVDMVQTDHPYYADIQDELVALAVLAPCGPPKSSVEFTERLSRTWLLSQYGFDRRADREVIEANKDNFLQIAARYRSTFRRIGRGFDSGQHLDDFDALVVTIEGARNKRTAATQAHAVLELIMDLATRGGHEVRQPDGTKKRRLREVFFIFDEFSAVSERVDVVATMERGRSLGVSVMPTAQTWSALGPDEDTRRRVMGTAAGGWIGMGSGDPDAFAKQAGTQIVVETGVKKTASGPNGSWGDEGSGRAQNAFLVSPDSLRQLETGQMVLVIDGKAWWGTVTPAEVTQNAPALLSGRGLRKAVERMHVPILGERVPLKQIEAGLAAQDRAARADTTGAAAAASGAFSMPATLVEDRPGEPEEAVQIERPSGLFGGRMSGPVFPVDDEGEAGE